LIINYTTPLQSKTHFPVLENWKKRLVASCRNLIRTPILRVVALVFLGACLLPCLSYAQTTNEIVVSFEGNGIETSSVSNSLIYSFNSLAAGTYSTVTWTNVGTFSNLTIENPDQYGGSSYGSTNGTTLAGGNSTYADAIGGVNTNVSTGVSLTFSSPVSFFGLWWSAGDAGNALVFYNGTNIVGTYNTAYLYSKLTNSAYFGMPTGPYKGQDSGEPYVFLNFAGNNGTTFTSVIAYQISGSGGNFESDNWTVNTNAAATNGVIFENFGTTGGVAFTNTNNFVAPTIASGAVSTNGTLLISNTVNLNNYVLLATNGSTILVGSNNPSVTLTISNNASAYTVGGTNYTESLAITQTTNSTITSTLSSNSLVGVSSSTNFTLSITSPVVVGTNGGTVTLSYSSVTNGSGSQRLGGPSYVGSQTVSLLNVGLEVATPQISPTNVSLGFFHAGEPVTGTTNISIANISPSTPYTENLGFTTGASTGGVSNNGASSTTIAAGTTNTSLVIYGPTNNQVTNTALGVTNIYTGTQVINFTSIDPNGNLANYSLGSQTVTVKDIIYSGQSTWISTNGGNWSSFSNWNASGGTPGLDTNYNGTNYSSNDTATFNTNGSGTVTLNTNASIMTLTFSNAASSYTISGVGTLTLTNGSNAPTVNVQAGSDTFSADINLASSNVTFSNAAGTSLDLEGNVVGAGTLTKTGTGTIILGASNSYAGGTAINAGTVAISDNNAFGTGTVSFVSNATVATLANQSVTNNYTVASSVIGAFDPNGFILTNSGIISGNGGISLVDTGRVVLTGANTYSGGTLISSGVLQIGNGGTSGSFGTGNFTTNNGTLDFDLSTNVAISSIISGTGTLIQDGTGTITLSGNNSYTGPTIINSGTLLAGNNNAFGSTTSTMFVNDGGTLNVSNKNITQGSVWLGNGTITGSGGAYLSGTNFTATNTGQALVAVPLEGTGAFIQSGTGTTTLTAADTYSGGTTLNAGTLAISNNTAMGTGTVTFASNATIAALTNLKVTNNYSISSGATATFTNSGYTFTNTGAISGAGGLTSIGTGTLTLTGTNTYSGATTITGDTLSLSTNGKLTATTNIVVNSGGTLLLGGTNQTTTNTALTLNGGTISTGGGSSTRAGTNSFSTLTLTANSTINFSTLTGNTSLDFNSILASYLLTNTLTILDWSGTEASGQVIGGGTKTALIDFAGIASLNAAELSHISFYSGNTTNSGFLGTGTFDGSGVQIVPVPEPAVITVAGLLLGWMMTSLVPTIRRKTKLRDRENLGFKS